MTDRTKRGAKEGLGFGLIAGVAFVIANMIGAAMMGNSSFMPFRLFASILLGEAAVTTASIGTAIILGGIVHLFLSALYGVIYGMVNGWFSPETEVSWWRQVGLGALFGAVIWFVNFQIIARIGYPWFLGTPQFIQFALHALFFGLPLALMYAAKERRVQHVESVPGHA